MTPKQAEKTLLLDRPNLGHAPKNLEEQALMLVGETMYRTLIKEYTEKQWGRECKDLPPDLLRRIPVRFTFDNNYYNARFQGIPDGGYSNLMQKMLLNCDSLLGVDFFERRDAWKAKAERVIFSGPIDAYFNFQFGPLAYRGLQFVEQKYNCENYQGNAVINWIDKEIPYTRTIEHRFFEQTTSKKTIVTYEYPISWKPGDYPYYPINDETNMVLFRKYSSLAANEKNVFFGGRLGSYQYLDMQDTIIAAWKLCNKLIGE